MKKLLLAALTLYGSMALAVLPKNYVAVAGRGGSAVTLLDSTGGEVLKTITSTDVGFEFEPMYISHVKAVSLFAVGDRKSSQILLFDDMSAQFLGKVTVSKGVFHQWHNAEQNQIAVVGDIDRSVDLLMFERQADKISVQRQVFKIPATYPSGVPHDVVVGDGFFYVTIKGANIDGKKGDYLLQVDSQTLNITGELTLSEDIHLGMPQNSPYLLVVEQATGQLSYFDKKTLAPIKTVLDLPGAHGIFWSEDASQVFVANITASIDNAIFEVLNVSDKNLEPVIVNNAPTSKGAIHNLVADFTSNRLFATHSGAQSKAVSVFDINNNIQLLKVVDTAANPFGIAIIKR